jgi:molecular chaperone HtpG
VPSNAQTLEFEAETRQLLHLVVHSLYSNKDIFLRELISNASDALDKLRLESLQDSGSELQVDASDLHIELESDSGERTLTVRDNGVGMSRQEVIELIGTIAKSGTAALLEQLKAANDSVGQDRLIGQFGVGFYSVFMVADKVTLTTRRAGETGGTLWESNGESTYEISDLEDAPQGTSVTLHLKPVDTENQVFDYAAEHKVREIVKRYSDFIRWPIRWCSTRQEESGTVVEEPKTINSMRALWTRSRSEVEDSEYHEFYKQLAHDWADPLDIIHMKAEGTFEYEALLFLPSHALSDLYAQDIRRGVQLYVNRVFIMEECEALVPRYLRFVKGVVDAHDLSLNVSRELLQHDRQIRGVRRRLVKKVLGSLGDLQKDKPEKYLEFWSGFGSVLKEGLLEDTDNQAGLLDLLLLESTRDPKEQTTLREYVERMKEGQEEIYYLAGASRTAIENSPHMEAFQARGFEVLILPEGIDEVWPEQVADYDGKALRSIAKGNVDLGAGEGEDGEAKKEEAERQEEFAGLLGFLTQSLAEHVKESRLSSRLTSSPACLVGDEHDMTPALEKMYRAMGQSVPRTKRILEINASHPLITALRSAHEKASEAGGEKTGEEGAAALEPVAQTAELLYAIALLAEGGELSDPARFSRLMADRLTQTV